MKTNVYVVYDKVSSSVATGIMCAESDAIMMRNLKSAKLGAVIEENLQDFDLYCLGVIDPLTMDLTVEDKRFVAHLEAFKNA